MQPSLDLQDREDVISWFWDALVAAYTNILVHF